MRLPMAIPASPLPGRGISSGQEARRAGKNGVKIAYLIPKEGTYMWFDNLAIPADAKMWTKPTPSSTS